MSVWRFEYGGTPDVVEFSQEEAERLVTRQHCAVDVQQFKNGLARIYTGPAVWNSYDLTINITSAATETNFNALKALRVPVKFYPRYHTDQVTYVDAAIVPETAKVFAAGHLATAPLNLKLIETTA